MIAKPDTLSLLCKVEILIKKLFQKTAFTWQLIKQELLFFSRNDQSIVAMSACIWGIHHSTSMQMCRHANYSI